MFQFFVIEIDQAKNLESEDFLSVNKCKRQCVEDVTRKENFDLQKYINDLRQERKLWQSTLKERKSKRRVLSKQKSVLVEQGQNFDSKALSVSERNFLSASPNYEYIYENNQKLSDMALKITLLNELVFKLNERFMVRMKEKLDKTTKKVIAMSG